MGRPAIDPDVSSTRTTGHLFSGLSANVTSPNGCCSKATSDIMALPHPAQPTAGKLYAGYAPQFNPRRSNSVCGRNPQLSKCRRSDFLQATSTSLALGERRTCPIAQLTAAGRGVRLLGSSLLPLPFPT